MPSKRFTSIQLLGRNISVCSSPETIDRYLIIYCYCHHTALSTGPIIINRRHRLLISPMPRGCNVGLTRGISHAGINGLPSDRDNPLALTDICHGRQLFAGENRARWAHPAGIVVTANGVGASPWWPRVCLHRHHVHTGLSRPWILNLFTLVLRWRWSSS